MRALFTPLCCLVALAALAARAQTPDAASPPSRIANTWNGQEHAASPLVVPHGDPVQRRQEVDELEQLNQQLQSRVQQETATPPAR